MNEQLLDVVDYTRRTLGLQSHELKRYHFFREKNHFNETAYIVCMEWFPHDADVNDDETNPEGTAVVDVDFYTKAVRRVVFVHNVNNADTSLYPASAPKEDVIEWIEDMTGLTFGRQFLIAQEETQQLQFNAAVDNIPVSPEGTIHAAFDDDGVLTSFDVDGHFPGEEEIEWEPFALTPDKYEPVAKEQCQLIEFPDEMQAKCTPVYAIEEVFLTNDAERTIPLTYGENRSSFVAKDKPLKWTKPLEGEFEQKDIDLSPEVTLDSVLKKQPHPDTIPLSEAEVLACEEEVLRFMRLVYPDESGKHKLSGIYLYDNYIIAEIKPVEDTRSMFDKVKVIIERGTLTAINHIDQGWMLEGFQDFLDAGEPSVSLEAGFNQLREYLQIEPVYVYDSLKQRYMMCGKLDCAYGVNAVTGEVMALNAL